MPEFPHLMHTAIDTNDGRSLAEFYREFLGLQYRPGDEPPTDGSEDDDSWLVLVDADGRRKVAVQRVDDPLPHSTWPSHEVPMQLHLDFSVSSPEELERQKERAIELGATVLLDRTEESEALYVLADPAGHPFCILTR
ncbi:VOC family protein [Luteipulveratus mongoliensis]|uniref:Glyoxalase n=1 Tax=Luteipulveratus mongoliensis TaxID=571913 RepID=A0A0K1JKD7_9MICO|nr:VOC family protein [Luteipulveratus mongoliensis]AKU17166.1 glyoxalase [Luteipulveratus mongoliensis]